MEKAPTDIWRSRLNFSTCFHIGYCMFNSYRNRNARHKLLAKADSTPDNTGLPDPVHVHGLPPSSEGSAYRHRSVSPPGDATGHSLPNAKRDTFKKSAEERKLKNARNISGLQVPRQDWQENFVPLRQLVSESLEAHFRPPEIRDFPTTNDQFHIDCAAAPIQKFQSSSSGKIRGFHETLLKSSTKRWILRQDLWLRLVPWMKWWRQRSAAVHTHIIFRIHWIHWIHVQSVHRFPRFPFNIFNLFQLSFHKEVRDVPIETLSLQQMLLRQGSIPSPNDRTPTRDIQKPERAERTAEFRLVYPGDFTCYMLCVGIFRNQVSQDMPRTWQQKLEITIPYPLRL